MSGARTAVVTGASGGIGEAFAVELAARGYRLVLVARSGDALDALAARLRAVHPVDVSVLSADLTEPSDLGRVEQRLADPAAPVDLLVNNAGALGRLAPLVDQAVTDQERLIRLDVVAVLRLCRAALRGMVGRGAGGVLNVSSVMGFVPAPQGATYSAAKAFVTAFSESLNCEVRPHGVTVTALCPGSVRTGLHRDSGRRGGRLGGFLEPGRVVRDGLAALEAGRPLCVPGAGYRVKVRLAALLPRPMVTGYVLRRFGGPPHRAAQRAAGPA
jgi:uncharacterized protein